MAFGTNNGVAWLQTNEPGVVDPANHTLPFTILACIYPTSLSGYQGVIAWGANSNSSAADVELNGATLQGGIAGHYPGSNSITIPATNEWYIVGASHPNSSFTNFVCYRFSNKTIQTNNVNIGYAYTATPPAGSPLVVGYWTDGSSFSDHFHGFIAWVAVFRFDLSGTNSDWTTVEFKNLTNRGPGEYIFRPDRTGFLGMYGNRGEFVDLSGNGYNAALQSGPQTFNTARPDLGEIQQRKLETLIKPGPLSGPRSTYRRIWIPAGAGGGGNISISGASHGVATATGTLTVTKTITGSSAGTSTASGVLSVTRNLTGSSAGQATSTGTAHAYLAFSGSAAGQATASGTLKTTNSLKATSAGQATGSGKLTVTKSAAGSAAGHATVSGTLKLTNNLVGHSAGQATASGTLIVTKSATGVSAGHATVSGTLDAHTFALKGVSAGTGTASGKLSVTNSLVGASHGQATASGTIGTITTLSVSGASHGVATASGTLGVTRSLKATSAGTGAATGTLSVTRSLAGSAAGQATAKASLPSYTLVYDTFTTPGPFDTITDRTPDISLIGSKWSGWIDYGSTTYDGPIDVKNGYAVSDRQYAFDGGVIDSGASDALAEITFLDATDHVYLTGRLIKEATKDSVEYSGVYANVSKFSSICEVFYWDAPSGTMLDTAVFSVSITAGDTIGLSISGDYCQIYHNGIAVGSMVLTQTHSKRRSSLWGFQVTDEGGRFDNFKVTAPAIPLIGTSNGLATVLNGFHLVNSNELARSGGAGSAAGKLTLINELAGVSAGLAGAHGTLSFVASGPAGVSAGTATAHGTLSVTRNLAGASAGSGSGRADLPVYTVISDAFTGEGFIEGRTPDISRVGSTWDRYVYYDYTEGGAIYVKDGHAFSLPYYSFDGGLIETGIVDGTVSATFDNGYGYLFARASKDPSPYYGDGDVSGVFLLIQEVSLGQSQIFYYDVTSGNYHGRTYFTIDPKPGDRYTLSVSGNYVIAFQNGVPIGSLTLPDATSQKKTGLWGFNAINQGNSFSNFVVTATALPVRGESAGTGSASGKLSVTNSLTGTSNGLGSAAGALGVNRALHATSAGTGTASGTLKVTNSLTGTSAGVSAASGTLSVTRFLNGSSAGVSTANGLLGSTGASNGISHGVSTASGTLSVINSLRGTSAGVSGASGVLSVTRPLAGHSAGTSTVSGTAGIVNNLAGHSAGQASASGTLNVSGQAAGHSAGQASASGNLSVTRSLVGHSAGQASAVGAAVTILSFAAAAHGLATAIGTINVNEPGAGHAAGTGSAAGTLTVIKSLTGHSAGVGRASGNLNNTLILVSGSSAGVGGAAGTVHQIMAFSGHASGTAGAGGNLTSPDPALTNATFTQSKLSTSKGTGSAVSGAGTGSAVSSDYTQSKLH